MKAGFKELCGTLSAVLSLMATLSAMAAVHGGSRALYIQAIIFGLAGAVVALAALMRM